MNDENAVREGTIEQGDSVETLVCEHCERHPIAINDETDDALEKHIPLGCPCGAEGEIVAALALNEETVRGPFVRRETLSGSFGEFAADGAEVGR